MSKFETDTSMPKKISDEAVQMINSIGDVMRTLYELEGAAEKMVDAYFGGSKFEGEDERETWKRVRKIVGDTEYHARSIRAYLARLQATMVIRNTFAEPLDREIEQLGFEGYVGNNSVELSIPFDWIAASSAFIYSVKRFKPWQNLASATDAWHWIMDSMLKKFESHVPFELPLKKARVDIVVFKPRNRLGDPDHFWYRPVIDALAQRRFIAGDDAECLHIYVTYEYDKEHPEVRLKLSGLPNDYRIDVRGKELKRVF